MRVGTFIKRAAEVFISTVGFPITLPVAVAITVIKRLNVPKAPPEGFNKRKVKIQKANAWALLMIPVVGAVLFDNKISKLGTEEEINNYLNKVRLNKPNIKAEKVDLSQEDVAEFMKSANKDIAYYDTSSGNLYYFDKKDDLVYMRNNDPGVKWIVYEAD